MTTPFQAYKLYRGLKTHFTSEAYDWHKYNGSVKANEESFEARNDHFHFAKLAKKQDPKGFLLAAFSSGFGKKWIGELVTSEDCQNTYEKWAKRQESLSYCYKQELAMLPDDIDQSLICAGPNGPRQPYLLTMFLSKAISAETVLILQDHYNFFPYWQDCLKGNPIWEDAYMRLRKYSPFFKFDSEQFRQITLDRFGNP